MHTNTMKKILLSGMAIALAACGTGGTDAAAGTSAASSAAAAASQGEEKVYKVAIVKLLDHASLDEIANAITAELDKLAEENGVTIDYGEVYSGQNDATTLQQIAAQALSDEVDVIIPIATLAAQTMASAAQESQTPVVFAAISDPEAAELTDLPYVTGTSDALNTEQIMDMIFLQNPEADTIGLLYSQSEANSTKSITEAKAYLEEKGVAYVEATANTSDEVITAVSTLISDGVDAVFTPTDNIIMAAELAIAPTLIEAGIPHYTGADSFVRNGAYATCGVNYTDLGTETADLAYQTMTEGIESTGYAGSYEVMPGGIITVNVETAAALGLDYSVFSSLGTVNEVTTTED